MSEKRIFHSANLLAIDPGINIGYAYWKAEAIYPEFHGNIYCKVSGLSWEQRLDVVLLGFHNILEKLPNKNFITVCEKPTFFKSEKGQSSAESNALTKLAVAYGRIWEACYPITTLFFTVEIQQWKAQLTKEMVAARLDRILVPSKLKTPIKDHALDAVGIGLYMKGLMK